VASGGVSDRLCVFGKNIRQTRQQKK